MSNTTLIPSQRHLFDIPKHIAYFNSAYNSPQLNESRQRLHEGVDSKSHPWNRSSESFFGDADKIRTLAAKLFGYTADGYAIVPAASYGVSSAARIIEPLLKKNDVILHVAEEFPSNVLPWKRLVKETSCTLATVDYPHDGDWTNAIINKLDKNIKVVAVSSCHWTNGALIDLERLGDACRANGSIFVVDATQSLGAMPLSVEKVKADFLVSSGYKWLLCPYGFSLLYVAEHWRNSRPLEETWLSRHNAGDFTALVKYSDDYMPGSQRFDVGEKCTATILPGAIAALEQILEWGVENVAHSLEKINDNIGINLEKLGFTLPHKSLRCPHMFGAILPTHFTGNLVSELKSRNIFVSQRGNSIRFAPHLHINDADVERLISALTDLVTK